MKPTHLVILAALAILGVVAALRMPRDIDPPLPQRAVHVFALAPGIAPEVLEQAVTVPVEQALADLPGIASIASRSGHGTCTTTLALETGMPPAHEARTLGALRERIGRLRGQLAPRIPVLSGPWVETSQTSGLHDTLLLTSPDKARELAPLLRALPSVAHAIVLGEPLEAIHVHYRDEDLADAGLTPQLLATRLRAYLATLPGGYLTDPDAERVLPVLFEQGPGGLAGLQELPVRDPRDGSVTPLGEICDVLRAPIEPLLGGVRMNGQPAAAIALRRRPSATPAVYARELDSFLRDHPEVRCLLDRPGQTRELTGRALRLILFSSLLVFAAIALLLGLRAALASSVAIAVTIGIAALFLSALGMTWNVVTLAALSVSVGLLVDNHIVLAHHARGLLAEGLGRHLLARCRRQLARPLAISMLTTALAILPAWLLRDGPGEYVADLAPVVIVCLVVSLLVGFFLTPRLANLGLDREHARPHPSPAFLAAHRRLVGGLRRSTSAIALGLIAVGAGALLLSRALPRAPIPALTSDRQIVATIDFSPATTQDHVSAASAALATLLSPSSGHTDTDAKAGSPLLAEFLGIHPPAVFRGMHLRAPSPSRATLLTGPLHGPILQPDLASWKKRFPGAVLRLRPLELTPAPAHPAAIRLTAAHRHDLDQVIANPDSPLPGELRPLGGSPLEGLLVSPQLEDLAAGNFLPLDLASAAAAASTGIPVTYLDDGDRRLPVLLRQDSGLGDDPEIAIEEAYVHRAKGRPQFLEDLAEIRRSPLPARLDRWGGRPSLTLVGDASPDGEIALSESLQATHPGLLVEPIGGSALGREPILRVGRVLPFIGAGILLLLLLQTGSVAQTGAVLLNALPALAGSLVALLLAGQALGVMSLLGMVTVGGILVNNAVLMLDRLRSERACSDDEVARVAADRLVPILTTTLCAILGVLPLILSGSQLWAPFAVALVGGVAGATLTTLLWIPASWRGSLGERD